MYSLHLCTSLVDLWRIIYVLWILRTTQRCRFWVLLYIISSCAEVLDFCWYDVKLLFFSILKFRKKCITCKEELFGFNSVFLLLADIAHLQIVATLLVSEQSPQLCFFFFFLKAMNIANKCCICRLFPQADDFITSLKILEEPQLWCSYLFSVY